VTILAPLRYLTVMKKWWFLLKFSKEVWINFSRPIISDCWFHIGSQESNSSWLDFGACWGAKVQDKALLDTWQIEPSSSSARVFATALGFTPQNILSFLKVPQLMKSD